LQPFPWPDTGGGVGTVVVAVVVGWVVVELVLVAVVVAGGPPPGRKPITGWSSAPLRATPCWPWSLSKKPTAITVTCVLRLHEKHAFAGGMPSRMRRALV
jgi:hypothetical protein